MTAPLIDASLATGMDTVRAIHASDLRAEDTLAACIERITATEARVNAFTDATFARAMREAQVIDARRAHGDAVPPLAGLPYAVRNLFDIEGLTTRAGSKVRNGEPAAREDAVLVQRLPQPA